MLKKFILLCLLVSTFSFSDEEKINRPNPLVYIVSSFQSVIHADPKFPSYFSISMYHILPSIRVYNSKKRTNMESISIFDLLDIGQKAFHNDLSGDTPNAVLILNLTKQNYRGNLEEGHLIILTNPEYDIHTKMLTFQFKNLKHEDLLMEGFYKETFLLIQFTDYWKKILDSINPVPPPVIKNPMQLSNSQ